MAHQINHHLITGKDSFFSVKEKAWHGLGTIVQDYPTSAEAIKFAGLDYTVDKRPLFTADSLNYEADGEIELVIPEIAVPNFFATIRSDTEQVLGVVGRDYHVVQNVQAFDFFDAIIGGKDGIRYETAGALGNGERIFITAKLPDYIRVGRNDCIEKYLFLTTSHDGFGCITAAFTPVRVVCANTLNAALRNQTNSIKIRHTANANERLKQAHHLLGLTNLLANELQGIYNQWSRVRISDKQVKKLVQIAMAPNKEMLVSLQKSGPNELSTAYDNIVNNVLEYGAVHPSQQIETTKGTLFGAYNAITGYYQNVKNYKNEESKFKSIFYGQGLQHSQTAFDLCAEFAVHGVNTFKLN